MSDPHDDQRPDTPPAGQASETLNDALDDLEDMLDLQGDADEQASDDGDEPQVGGATLDDAQFTIPLLSDVVSPVSAPASIDKPASVDDDYSESAQHMAERLSSEIDIIVQSAVDEAIDLLRRDIADRLREHLDITLPEVLEELVHLRRR